MKVVTVQTRSEDNGIRLWNSFKEAYAAAQEDESIWKISFDLQEGDYRIRLVKDGNGEFVLEMMDV